jgi:Icc protein
LKLGWLSDLHLNFLDAPGRRRFMEELAARTEDAWLFSGDLGEAPTVVAYLEELGTLLPVPLYFVLGNHDFYRGSIEGVTEDVASLSRSRDGLVWLTEAEPRLLAPGLALVGDDGWGDARLGDPQGTLVMFNDFFLIQELTGHRKPELVRRLNLLGDESARRLGPKLEAAAGQCRNVIVVTHVPPFEGACWHEGTTSSEGWLPWLTCDAVGRTILDVAGRHAATRFLVLCGHTHSLGRYAPAPNVLVHTAGASYGDPSVQGFVDFDGGSMRLAV